MKNSMMKEKENRKTIHNNKINKLTMNLQMKICLVLILFKILSQQLMNMQMMMILDMTFMKSQKKNFLELLNNLLKNMIFQLDPSHLLQRVIISFKYQ